MAKVLTIAEPNPKQKLFLEAKHKYVGFGGARGGGKSWSVRTKAKLLALHYPGIRVLIVRRTYPELMKNHIRWLRVQLLGIAKYNDKDKVMNFGNTSTISFMYCARDQDLDHLQGDEYDVIFLDEATQLSEWQIKSIVVCMRAPNNLPKRCYFTMNPGGKGHAYIKRLFIDRKFEEGEDPEEYTFIQSLVTDNTALMKMQPDYVKQLDALPEKLKAGWRYGDWEIYDGQFFEDFINRTTPVGEGEDRVDDPHKERRWTNVIDPFEIPKEWPIYRSFDFGYSKPFSCGWWTVDYDGRMYRILDMYGCTKDPNTGVK
ncbi:MAG TPA: phage terminase large subunit, partial [Anaerovoracaceae bacterium]|nr:phage terminase large subunit [Anaerovoracaceae bacterium]